MWRSKPKVVYRYRRRRGGSSTGSPSLSPGERHSMLGDARANNKAPGFPPKLLQAWDDFRTTSVVMLDKPRKNRPHSGLLSARGHSESRTGKRFGSYQSVWWHGTFPTLLHQTRRRDQLVTKTRQPVNASVRPKTYVSTWRPGLRASQSLLLWPVSEYVPSKIKR